MNQVWRATGVIRPLLRRADLWHAGAMRKAARTSLSAREVKAIRDSFVKATAKPGEVSERFYQRLFALDPSVRGLFHGDMREQGRKLVDTLNVIVASIGDLERLLPSVRDLGTRHAHYGVKEHHYATVGKALLWALAQSVGQSFGKPARVAWQKAYRILADEMIRAAKVGA